MTQKNICEIQVDSGGRVYHNPNFANPRCVVLDWMQAIWDLIIAQPAVRVDCIFMQDLLWFGHIACTFLAVAFSAAVHPSDDRVYWILTVYLYHMFFKTNLPSCYIVHRSQLTRTEICYIHCEVVEMKPLWYGCPNNLQKAQNCAHNKEMRRGNQRIDLQPWCVLARYLLRQDDSRLISDKPAKPAYQNCPNIKL